MPSSVQSLVKTVQLKHPAFSGAGRDVAVLTCAADFDARKPFNIVLFFHGFDHPLDKQIVEHALPAQVVESRRNCVLVCPRTAINRQAEANPGAFGDADVFSGFIDELPGHIKCLLGDQTLDPDALGERADRASLIIATFSAGHRSASRAMSHPLVRDRLAVLAFFDSLYRSNAYFNDPGAVLKKGALVGVHRAAYDSSGPDERNNHRDLTAKLASLHAVPATSVDSVPLLKPGVAVMESVDIGDHWQIVANGSRLAKILSKVEVPAEAGQPVLTS